jgi:gliding motility-associated-like protein
LSYAWKNETAQTIGNTVSLTGVQPGRYQLEVKDGNGCTLTSAWYTVAPVVTALPVPVYDPQTIPRYGAVTVRVKQVYPGGTYTLYDPSTGATLQRNSSGVFTLSNVANDLQLAVKVEAGPCSSAAGAVSVKVIDITQLDIPNAFSPNGDGINDQFRIRVTGYFKLDGLLIFNRWGQKVFDTKDINREWTGTLNGNPLAVGTYYYIIEGIDVKGEKVRKSGSITLLR